jgi:homoserine O-acetyltransferase
VLKPSTFDLNLPTFVLEGGAALTSHRVRGWVWSTHDDDDAIASLVAGESTALTRDIPTVLVVHALTGDACVGGPGGWWEPLIGPGRAIDTDRFRVLCFNNLGSCYGTTGPDDHDFPRRRDESRGEIDPDAASRRAPRDGYDVGSGGVDRCGPRSARNSAH